MLIESAMVHDTQKHTCTRCEQTSRGVDWQPLLGEFMHYECWLELATEVIRSKRIEATARPVRIADALQLWFDLELPEQTELL